MDAMEHIDGDAFYTLTHEAERYYVVLDAKGKTIAKARPFYFFEKDEILRVYIAYAVLKDGTIRLPTPNEQHGDLFDKEKKHITPYIASEDEYLKHLEKHQAKIIARRAHEEVLL
jgi:hypothetical protein